MNIRHATALRRIASGAALGALTLAAIPSALAQHYSRPYYDPVRDVMVTPRLSQPSAPATQPAPDASARPARTPIYGSYQPEPRIQPVPQSSAGLEQPAATTARPRVAQPYYDPVRDVMVTPSVSGAVPYTGSSLPAAPEAPASTFEWVVRNGRLVEGPASIAVDHGSKVTMIVDSDVQSLLRIDGYNLAAPVMAGQPLLLSFVAEQPGRFAYRLGSGGQQIGVIEVGPPAPADARVGLR